MLFSTIAFSQTDSTKKNLDITTGNGNFPNIKYLDYNNGTGVDQDNNGKNSKIVKPDNSFIRLENQGLQFDKTKTTR